MISEKTEQKYKNMLSTTMIRERLNLSCAKESQQQFVFFLQTNLDELQLPLELTRMIAQYYLIPDGTVVVRHNGGDTRFYEVYQICQDYGRWWYVLQERKWNVRMLFVREYPELLLKYASAPNTITCQRILDKGFTEDWLCYLIRAEELETLLNIHDFFPEAKDHCSLGMFETYNQEKVYVTDCKPEPVKGFVSAKWPKSEAHSMSK